MNQPLSNRFPTESFTLSDDQPNRHVLYEGRIVGEIYPIHHRVRGEQELAIRLHDPKNTRVFGVSSSEEPALIYAIQAHLDAEINLLDENKREYSELKDDYERVTHRTTRDAILFATRKSELEIKTSVEILRLFEPDFKLNLSPMTEAH